MQNFKKNMHACEDAAGEKLRQNGPFVPTNNSDLFSFGNFIYVTIFCNDYALHDHRLYQISSSLEANSSLEDVKQLCECVDRSHLHTGNIPT